MSSIFGGSKSKSSSKSSSLSTSSSSNLAFPLLKDQFGTGADLFKSSSGTLKGLLGGGFDEFKDNMGYDFQLNEGRSDIMGGAANKGVFQSGATAKALANYQEGLRQSSFGSYLENLFKQSSLGLGLGQLLSGAGNVSSSYGTSNSTSESVGKSSPGIAGFLGSIFGGAAASDRRLKKNIQKIGQLSNGLNIYRFDYIDGRGPYIGVMADEVAVIQPEALGPVVDGYNTVYYDKIGQGGVE
jgi:hypothetical protein